MRLTRKDGGALLGEGAKGIVYDTYDPDKAKSFYTILSNKIKRISQIVLYSDSEKKYTVERSSLADFIEYLKTTNGTIAKLIKKPRTDTRKLKYKKRVDDELHSNIKIINMLDSYSDKYLTIDPGLTFNGLKFYSCCIFYTKPVKRQYVIFGKKCGYIFQLDLDILISDILAILKLCENKVKHNDIKFENIMYCDGRYKLIDWGNASFKEELRGGVFMGPLKNYLCGVSIKDSINDLPKRLAKRYPEMYHSKLFKHIYAKIIAEFNTIIEKQSEMELMNSYKGNHDLFAFGMTILQILIKKNLAVAKYIPLIELLTSYKDTVSVDNVIKFISN